MSTVVYCLPLLWFVFECDSHLQVRLPVLIRGELYSSTGLCSRSLRSSSIKIRLSPASALNVEIFSLAIETIAMNQFGEFSHLIKQHNCVIRDRARVPTKAISNISTYSPLAAAERILQRYRIAFELNRRRSSPFVIRAFSVCSLSLEAVFLVRQGFFLLTFVFVRFSE